MNSLQNYGSSSETETDSDSETETTEKKTELVALHLKPVDPSVSIAKTLAVVAAPDVIPLVRQNCLAYLHDKYLLLVFVGC